jgi:hypothetical protein
MVPLSVAQLKQPNQTVLSDKQRTDALLTHQLDLTAGALLYTLLYHCCRHGGAVSAE